MVKSVLTVNENCDIMMISYNQKNGYDKRCTGT